MSTVFAVATGVFVGWFFRSLHEWWTGGVLGISARRRATLRRFNRAQRVAREEADRED